jgi:calcineurin-like phosphoesterase family protein
MKTLKLDLAVGNVFFAADAHFLHKNVLQYDQRPFADVQTMGEEIIANWNRVVAPGDTVFYLGDFALGNEKPAKAIAHQLNGCIHYILGNHDSQGKINRMHRFASVEHYRRIAVLDPDAPTGQQDIVLSHYPMLAWDMDAHGGWMLHGHTHGSLDHQPFHQAHKIYDVALNTNYYTPVSYKYLKLNMLARHNKGHH